MGDPKPMIREISGEPCGPATSWRRPVGVGDSGMISWQRLNITSLTIRPVQQ